MIESVGHCSLTREVCASVDVQQGRIAIHAGGDLSISICWIHPDEAREFARLLIDASDIAERKRQQGEACADDDCGLTESDLIGGDS